MESMERPEITRDQRELAIELLANALRKDAHLRQRAKQPGTGIYMTGAGITQRRADASQRYVDGMRDLLRVLFPNGHAVADECLNEAYARAMGVPPRGDRDDTMRGH
jgi:hypothetical protein